MDAECDKLTTVVGRTKVTVLATLDVRPTSFGQFITLIVDLCVQQKALAATRLGSICLFG